MLPMGLTQGQLDRSLESSPESYDLDYDVVEWMLESLPYWDVDEEDMPPIYWGPDLRTVKPGTKCECEYAGCRVHAGRQCQMVADVRVHEWADKKHTFLMCEPCGIENGMFRDALIIVEELC